MSKPVIVVFGATGKTGGGMVNAILADGSYTARAVTRNPDSESQSLALAAKGVEVVQADLNEPSTPKRFQSMQGAYGVFGVTDCMSIYASLGILLIPFTIVWQAFMAEEKQGRDMVDAAKAAGIKHFVWTTLDHSEWKTPHFETKARVNDYLIESGIPRTSVYTAYFAENLKSPFFGIKRSESGRVVVDVAYKTDGKLPIISAADIGSWSLVAFKNPDQWIGKDMKLATEWLSVRDIAKIISEEIGEPVDVKEVDETMFQNFRSKEYEEIWLNLQTFYTAGPDYRDVELTNKLLPNATRVKDLIHSWGNSLVQ